MKRQRVEYDVDADVDARKLLKRDEVELSELNPDQFRMARYGVDGTKIFICQVTPGVYTVKMLGKNHGATSKAQIMGIIEHGLTTRFGL